jgi:hypothetical protein
MKIKVANETAISLLDTINNLFDHIEDLFIPKRAWFLDVRNIFALKMPLHQSH